MSTKEFIQGIDRRSFLKIISFTGIMGLIYPRKLLSSVLPRDLSRVVIVEHDDATSGTTINGDTVQVMMDSGVQALAAIDDTGEAWKSLFPGISGSSVIAIKVNCINSSMPTHPDVTNAVVNGLKQMSFGFSFPENNIIIFDRTTNELQSSGYTINSSGTGVRCFGTNYSGIGYSSQSYSVHGSNQKLSSIITDMADYIINISVLKNHSISGVTLCLKNHYGTCNSPGQLHGGNANPYIPALNALSQIKDKQYINIVDALFGIYTGGPSGNPQFIANKIIMSQDIVAADYWGRELLEENGCTTTGQATHIDTAAQSPYNLGTNNPFQMEVINVTNPYVGIDQDSSSAAPADFRINQNYPNPFSGNTKIEFYVPGNTTVDLSVYDINGRQIRGLVNKSVNKGWHNIHWDGTNDLGRQVSGGLYVGQLKTSGFQKSIIMQMVK